MNLDSAAEQYLQLLVAAARPPLQELSPDEARASYDMTIPFAGDGADVASVTPMTIDGVPCHLVMPHGVKVPGVLIWFHGGGWVIGSGPASIAVCRDLAAASNCAVLTVDYRLAPEHRAPAAVVDCVGVARWVVERGREIGVDPSRVAVGGDSAGGNLAALVALELGDRISHQLLVYPATDLSMSHPSIEENAEGYLLTKASMRWFIDHYLSTTGISATDPSVSPLFADPKRLSKAASASVLVAGFDPLCDEGIAYANALRAAGVTTELRRFDSQIHAFFSLRVLIPEAGDAIAWGAAAVGAALSR